ncbi:MAG: hypothetical protein EOO75_20535 [Myxococcales bacterium]|nr:MAG: hypothetical protein EOO75_20535 [Myxococcales bacterium]
MTTRERVAVGGCLVALVLGACTTTPRVKDTTPPGLEKSTGIATADPATPDATLAPSASTGLPRMPAYR